jgi:2-hydroxychromene-2-carboxylate isomerase
MRVELYFDFSCPFAYLASACIEALCARAGAELVWRPMLLGGVFRSSGHTDEPMRAMGPAKARHSQLDIHRWAESRGVPLTMPAGHPMRTVRALRALLALPEPRWPAVIHGLYHAYWQRGDDITSAEVVAAVLAEAGIDPADRERALAAHDDPTIKDALRRRTEEAAARGVFGAPTMFVHVDDLERPEMFWGQDRLHLVEAMLAGWRPGHGPAPIPAAPIPEAPDAPLDSPPTLHFWYDIASPFAYLASTQIEALAARAGARLVWQPMLIGGLFKEVDTPNVPLFAMPPAKRAYVYRDLDHWADYLGVPFRFASRFPMRTVTALRLALLAGDHIAPLSHALFRALWVEDRDVDDARVLAEILRQHGFDADHLLALTQEPAVKQALVNQTSRAVAAGVFGAPTVIVEHARPDLHGDRRGAPLCDLLGALVFWGLDRLPLVERAARGWRPRAG